MLSSFRERYTAVRRLALSSSTTTTLATGGNEAKNSPGGIGSSKTVCIEVQFIGPQPSQGPGALLCNLLSGTSVEARPIELRRGRDNKRKRRDSGSDEGSDPGQHSSGLRFVKLPGICAYDILWYTAEYIFVRGPVLFWGKYGRRSAGPFF